MRTVVTIDNNIITSDNSTISGTVKTESYRVIFPKGYKTVEKIAKEYENNIVIVRIDGHLTTCRFGVCEDIWDCSQEKVDCFWIVQ